METRRLIRQGPDWPKLRYDTALAGAEIARDRRAQGVVEGTLAALGFNQRTTLVAEAWSQEAVATAAIEGERLDLLLVRSSVARCLGVGVEKGLNVPDMSMACSTSWMTPSARRPTR